MKSTSDIAKECGAYESCVAETLIIEESMFEAFRKAVEADFVSRCELAGYKFIRPDSVLDKGVESLTKYYDFAIANDTNAIAVYTLPTIME